jgi:hypothetical protein
MIGRFEELRRRFNTTLEIPGKNFTDPYAFVFDTTMIRIFLVHL